MTATARRDELVSKHLGLVHPIARSVSRRLPPSFDLDDLISEGYLGLMNAALRYRPREHNGTPFSAFARPRIHGAIVDSIRRRCWAENTAFPLEDAPEQVTEPGLPYLIKYCKNEPRRRGPGRPASTMCAFHPERLPKPLAEALRRLPARQRAVLGAFYGDGETTQGVARALGLTAPQVVREHAAALDTLHAALLQNVSIFGSTLVFLSSGSFAEKRAA